MTEISSSVVHRQASPHYDILGDGVHYPVDHNQVRDLVGKLLTQLDAMALSDRAHRAARTLFVQQIWAWWGNVHENAVTSTQGCIAPVVMTPGAATPSNRWGWASEQAYLDSLKG